MTRSLELRERLRNERCLLIPMHSHNQNQERKQNSGTRKMALPTMGRWTGRTHKTLTGRHASRHVDQWATSTIVAFTSQSTARQQAPETRRAFLPSARPLHSEVISSSTVPLQGPSLKPHFCPFLTAGLSPSLMQGSALTNGRKPGSLFR